jgi:hypothetical protein
MRFSVSTFGKTLPLGDGNKPAPFICRISQPIASTRRTPVSGEVPDAGA